MVKHSRVMKNREQCKSFLPRTFYRITYTHVCTHAHVYMY